MTTNDPRSAERRAAFEAEALPHLDALWAAARRMTRGVASAAVSHEDLVQDTFVRAYRAWDTFTPGTNCRAWLLKILHSVVVNRFHRSRLEPEAQDTEDLERRSMEHIVHTDWEAPLVATADEVRWRLTAPVVAALEDLPEAHRAVVLLVDVEDLTYEEAADVLDCPVGTVRSRLSRARRHLAGALAEHAQASGIVEGGS